MRLLPFLALSLFACRETGETKYVTDRDEDGIGEDDDCNDEDASVGGPATYYADYDHDGHGDLATGDAFCERPAGYVEVGDDCDDNQAAAYPGNTEVCDGIDNECDGTVDNGAESVLYYADADNDGYGDDASTIYDCTPPEGYATVGGDCNDNDAAYNPGALEEDCEDPSDYNCDGSVGYTDDDGDGFAACSECNDGDSTIFPGASESCNGIDDDCDGLVDDQDDSLDTSTASTWYADGDADGYGGSSTTLACEQPAGYASLDGDCDDSDTAYNPGASEGDCTDPNDYNCDGSVGYDDADLDGYSACEECDDGNAAINPSGTESCDGADNDCDGEVDEDSSIDAGTWYADADSDGYGDDTSTTVACDVPSGYVADNTDCDDTSADVSAAGTELCNGLDDNCDGEVDEDSAIDAGTWYADSDSDGYGDATDVSVACDAPAGTVADNNDCNDADLDINPAATEVCDGIDNDCDGSTDEDLSTSTWYEDDDGDGYGDLAVTDCAQPSGTVDNDWDCDDTSASVYPGNASSCPWTSCLDLLDDGIASADGNYWIDFDGTATQTECDMSTDGGGWTLIFSDDFDSGADSGWSTTTTTSCGAWGTILGGYGVLAGTTVDIDADAYGIVHSEAWLELEYAALDSWDGETSYVRLDGTTVWSQAQNNHSTSYSEVCGWNRGYYGSYDSLWPISEVLTQSDDSINVLAGSTLDQGAYDESFGIDDVYVWIR